MSISNAVLYNAALTGALSAVKAGHSSDPEAYGTLQTACVAFAAAVDALAPSGTAAANRALMIQCVATSLEGSELHGTSHIAVQAAACKALYDEMAESLVSES